MGQVREREQILKEWDTRNAERLAAMKRGKSMAGATAFMASIADKHAQQTGGPKRAAEGGTKTSGLASLLAAAKQAQEPFPRKGSPPCTRTSNSSA